MKQARELAVMDIETDPFKVGRKPEPFLIGVLCRRGYACFESIKEAAEYIKRNKFLCYAHNGGRFDFEYLLNFMEPGPIKLINGRLSEFRFGNSIMRDSMNIFPMALKNYQKDEIDYEKFERDKRAEYMDEIKKYLFHDCLYLLELIEKFHEHYGKRISLASSAKAFWENLSGYEIKWSSFGVAAGFYDRFHPFYFGGRVECLRPGIYEGPVKVFDINSAYPFAMTHKHPWGQNPVHRSTLPSSNLHRCFINCEAPSLGYWPVRNEKSGAIEFPRDGERRAFNVCGWEFIQALTLNPSMVVKVTDCYEFQEEIDFTEYIMHFYNMKKNSEKGSFEYLMAKLFMNGLYGKLAADSRNYKAYTMIEPEKIGVYESESSYRLAAIKYPMAIMQRDLTEDEMRFYHLPCAASITSFVRAMSLPLLFPGGKSFGPDEGPFYIDTDGIQAEELNVPISKELGDFNIEFECDKQAYAGKKLYALIDSKKYGVVDGKEVGCKIASKGVRLTAREIFEIAAGKVIAYTNPVPSVRWKKQPKTPFLTRKVRRTS